MPARTKPARKLTSSLFWLGVFIFWVIFFFPHWYVLSYTKIWELKQLMGRSREQQMRILHPAAMARLLTLRQELGAYSVPEVVVVLPTDSSKLPLAGNAPILRSVLYPYVVVPTAVAGLVNVRLRACDSLTIPDPCWEITP